MGLITIKVGIPGAGKSSSCVIDDDTVVCSADHFFTDPNGKYNFHLDKIGQAHAACWRTFLHAITVKSEKIIVDNTNIRMGDRAKYIRAGFDRGYTVVLQSFYCSIKDAIKRNQHNVPEETIARMYGQHTLPPGIYVSTKMSLEKYESLSEESREGLYVECDIVFTHHKC